MNINSTNNNEKHTTILNELKAELEATDNAPTDVMQFSATEKSQATMRGLVMNNGVDTIKFQEAKDWSGSVFGTYPPSITVERTVNITHQGVPPKDYNGSKGAVVYVGSNVQGKSDNCAWVLAWYIPGDGSSNKIYVETGPSTKYPFHMIDWDAIEGKLESSGSDNHYRDDDTGAEASAQITSTGNIPKVVAVFDATPN